MVFSKVSLNRVFFDRWECQAAERRTIRAECLVIGGRTMWRRLVRVESFLTRIGERQVQISNDQRVVYSYELGLSEFGETSSVAHHAGEMCPSMNAGSGPRRSTGGPKSAAKTEVLLQREWFVKFDPRSLSMLRIRALKLPLRRAIGASAPSSRCHDVGQ